MPTKKAHWVVAMRRRPRPLDHDRCSAFSHFLYAVWCPVLADAPLLNPVLMLVLFGHSSSRKGYCFAPLQIFDFYCERCCHPTFQFTSSSLRVFSAHFNCGWTDVRLMTYVFLVTSCSRVLGLPEQDLFGWYRTWPHGVWTYRR